MKKIEATTPEEMGEEELLEEPYISQEELRADEREEEIKERVKELRKTYRNEVPKPNDLDGHPAKENIKLASSLINKVEYMADMKDVAGMGAIREAREAMPHPKFIDFVLTQAEEYLDTASEELKKGMKKLDTD